MTLPDESRDVYWKSQEIWNWLVHPPTEWRLIMLRGGIGLTYVNKDVNTVSKRIHFLAPMLLKKVEKPACTI